MNEQCHDDSHIAKKIRTDIDDLASSDSDDADKLPEKRRKPIRFSMEHGRRRPPGLTEPIESTEKKED